IDTLVDVAFGNGIFVGVGLHSLRMSTTDGLTWSEPQRGKEGEHLNSIVFAAGRFVAVGLGVTFISPDGKTWTRSSNENAPIGCIFGNGAFIGAAWKGRILRSTDALAWKEVAKLPHNIEGLAFGGA